MSNSLLEENKPSDSVIDNEAITIKDGKKE